MINSVITASSGSCEKSKRACPQSRLNEVHILLIKSKGQTRVKNARRGQLRELSYKHELRLMVEVTSEMGVRERLQPEV